MNIPQHSPRAADMLYLIRLSASMGAQTRQEPWLASVARMINEPLGNSSLLCSDAGGRWGTT